MEESKKKPIMIGVVAVCLILAGVVTYLNSSGDEGGIDSTSSSEKVWVMCSNPDCEAKYEASKKEFLEFLQENQAGPIAPPMVCQECDEESIYRAEKCEECGEVFFRGSVPRDYADRCPECDYSGIEEKRKRRK